MAEPKLMPLYGTKTHPLTDAAKMALRSLPRPSQEINPGVVNRLLREDLAEPYMADSPYATRKGKIGWLRITDAGRAVIAVPDPGDR